VLAGVIAAFLFAPGEEQDAGGELARQVELGDLILVSALAGLAGTSFLAMVQERFLAALRTEEARTQRETTVQAMRAMPDALDPARAKEAAKVNEDEVRHVLDQAQERVPVAVMELLPEERVADSGSLELDSGEMLKPASKRQTKKEAAELVATVADPAVDALADQMRSQVELVLGAIEPAEGGAGKG
jgi:hypothetical protein